MAGVWVSIYCMNTEGFPKILYATLQKLGVKDRPEYEGREYEEQGTEQCEVTVYTKIWKESHRDPEAPSIVSSRDQADQKQLI